MSLTEEDLNRIQSFFASLEGRITTLEERIEERFDVVDRSFDALFKREEATQQENIVITEQFSRLEKRVSALEQGFQK